MWIPWVTAALAADDGFAYVRDAAGCRVWMRPETHPEGAAMRAECHWAEVDPGVVAAMITDSARYSEFVYPIAETRVERRTPDGRELVYQRQQVFGLADREVLLWMWREDHDDGAVRMAWTTAADQPLAVAPGAVRTPKNVGFWEVGPDPAGGAHVVHEIALDAGGSVPRWLVSLVRTRGFARLMEDMRRIAGGAA